MNGKVMDCGSWIKRFGDGVSPKGRIHENGTREHEANGKVDTAIAGVTPV
ncbi:hypothetical protein [Paenibacillus sp. SN-8-1]